MNNEYKEFMNLLEFSNGKYNTTDIFRDFVIMFAIAIKNRFNYMQEDENIYLGIIKKYTKSEGEIFIKLSAKLILVYSQQKEIKDVLGEIFQKIGANSKIANQYFTPMHVAKLMSDIILEPEEIKSKEFICINDPSCGSGVLILSTAERLKENKIDYKSKMLVEAQDIDFICTCMTYIQLSMYGIPGRVICGNTLLNERHRIFYTPQYFIGNWNKKMKK